MSDYEQKDNTGALFSNKEKKTTEKHPDYTGNVMVNGKKMRIASWISESKTGMKYMSLKFSDHQPKTNTGNTYTSTATDDSAEILF